MMEHPERGFTLLEIAVGSAIALVVMLGLTSVDATLALISWDIRRQAPLLMPEYGSAVRAVSQLAKNLERSDRLVIFQPGPSIGGGLLLRIPVLTTDNAACAGCAGAVPPPCCFDIAANYEWQQWSHDAANSRLIVFLNPNPPDGCLAAQMASQITTLSFQYRDEAATAPPGGELLVQDNNVVEYWLAWDNGLAGLRHRSHTFRGEVTIRAGAYTNVATGLASSGADIANPLDISPAPTPCDPPS